MSTAIVWFRNDLRLHDHEPLVKALEKYQQIVPFIASTKKTLEKQLLVLRKPEVLELNFKEKALKI